MYLPGGRDTQISCCCCCVKLPRRCLSLKFTFSCGKCQNSSEGNHAKRGLLLSAFFFVCIAQVVHTSSPYHQSVVSSTYYFVTHSEKSRNSRESTHLDIQWLTDEDEHKPQMSSRRLWTCYCSTGANSCTSEERCHVNVMDKIFSGLVSSWELQEPKVFQAFEKVCDEPEAHGRTSQ